MVMVDNFFNIFIIIMIIIILLFFIHLYLISHVSLMNDNHEENFNHLLYKIIDLFIHVYEDNDDG
jgi:hypothetical protein